MKGLLRVVCLIGLVVLLARCNAQGCTDIPEASDGPCRVGLQPGWDDDSSRYTR